MADSEKPAATSESQSAYSAPTISLPKGGGAIRGIGEKFGANPVTGTGSMTVPIATSPGRSNFGPQLSLSYDSGVGNGPFGFGWSLSIPGISRKTDKGLPQYRDDIESDVYIISAAEDLVPVLRGDGSRFLDDTSVTGYTIARYRPRIEGLFARIERWTNRATAEIHWRSISRDNITTVYGKTPESRVADPDDSLRVFSWLLCESYDSKGNAVVYRYSAEDDAGVDLTLASEQNRARSANRYLKRILYGNRVSRLIEPDLTQASWLFEVVFDYDEGHYEDLPLDPAVPEAAQHRYVLAADNAAGAWRVRPDPFSSYRATFEMRTYRRCHRILMFHHFAELGAEACLVRSTEFDYGDLDYSQPVPIDAELAHQGSTRFASFIRAVTHAGFVRDETRAVVERDGARYVTYLRKALPPLEFEYSKAVIQEDIREVDDITLENLPIGVDGSAYQWVDLDGEGVSGILTEQADAWFYKPNLGDGHFGPMQRVGPRPSPVALTGGRHQLLDLAGDGQLDVVSFTGPAPGFYERTEDDTWEPLRSFRSLPNIAWDDPNLRFVDLDGDGHADILLTEHEAFTWYPSLAEDGFAPPITIRHSPDEERGTRLLFADGTQSVYLADMTGDGLTDLVRIRNGEVCYWPNEGYCRFGPKVTMDGAPWLDEPDQFDHRRLRLADIDGSGTTDIVYLGSASSSIYFNQSGNRWTKRRTLSQLPTMDDSSSVLTADLLGNGTACIVWSTSIAGDVGRRMRFIDLMGGTKPHLLTKSLNNLGAETRISYAASTQFYLADKVEGKPWVTKLPFPVHVVERVESYDRISRNRFVSRYAYHHGYFDGVEREFRGFGMVEQWDTEDLETLATSEDFPTGANIEEASHVPPVLTRSWFHTGVYLGRDHVSDYFAGLLDSRDAGEYYREPGLNAVAAAELLLGDTVMPSDLTLSEEREACRSLKGLLLRQEVYARDDTDKAIHPYVVAEQNFGVRRLQAHGGNRHAVFLSHPRESINYHYERIPADPRIAHVMTLDVNDFGNVRKSLTVGYGRRRADPNLDPRDQAKQSERVVIYTESDFTNIVDGLDDYCAPLPCDARTYELAGYVPSGPGDRYQFDDFLRQGVADPVLLLDGEVPYEGSPQSGRQRRLIEHVRSLYRRDDLSGALPHGQLQSLALPFENYKLAFTPGLVSRAYGSRVTTAMLAQEGHYVYGDGEWWNPSGRVFYSADPSATASEELSEARAHFFRPRRYRDPFHTDSASTETVVSYDAIDLLLQETVDPYGNRVTAGERDVDPTQPLARHGNDYRVLQLTRMMDANRNRWEVAYDALGMVVGTAVMGKPENSPVPGDQLSPAFRPDLTEAEIDQFFADPESPIAATLLSGATTRIMYDVAAYWRTSNPTCDATLARETDASEVQSSPGSRIQIGLSYSDGFGRETQKKAQAEPGPVPKRDPTTGRLVIVDGQLQMTVDDVSPRWVASAWTIFNNKGKPSRQFEPFFTDTHRFEHDVRAGVSVVLFYDPLERIVGTLHPDHTWEKGLFDPWRQETWDRNDTVLITDPATDANAGAYFRVLTSADYLPTWYAARNNGALGPEEQDAAQKASIHANTPTIIHADALGRTVLTVSHNKFKHSDSPADEPPTEEFLRTRVLLDVEGNQREVIDAMDRVVARYDYDMVGTRVHQASMDAGERWTLNDVTGKPVRSWDSRGHEVRFTYDQLGRPVNTWLRDGDAQELLVSQMSYGEGEPNPEITNLRGKIVRRLDQAGLLATDEYDFKGNLVRLKRQVAQEYKTTLNWKVQVPLDAHVYANRTQYDALNRVTTVTMPDNTVIRQAYNEGGLLESLDANARGTQQNGQAVWINFISEVEYDAKRQRTFVRYGNGVTTTYTYDRLSFQMTHLLTRRDRSKFPDDCPQPSSTEWPGCELQNLSYTYDPIGNIAHIRDDAQQTIFFRNRRVEPNSDYIYDALYRLVEATGREHLGQVNASPIPHSYNDARRLGIAWSANDGNSMGRYIERYVYDGAGNILSMQHRRALPADPGWTREYSYSEPSLNQPDAHGNRLTSTTVGATTEVYSASGDGYDAHGNMLRMPHLEGMQWDYKDQLQMTGRQAVNAEDEEGVQHQAERTWYTYDAGGLRVRKVTEQADGQIKDERLYLGNLEVYRRQGVAALERSTLHLMDDKKRVALVETTSQGNGSETSTQLIRYQLTNHLGSAMLELDDQARIVSFEECTPYGSIVYQAVRSSTDAPKRYGWVGKERDRESGFTYHGARYYAPWLGRWTASDPAGIRDGLNTYAYVNGNPITKVDLTGGFEISWKEVAIGAGVAVLVVGVVVLTAGVAGPIVVPALAGALGVSEATVVTTAVVAGTAYGAVGTANTINEVRTGVDSRTGGHLTDAQRSRRIGGAAVGLVATALGVRGIAAGIGGGGGGGAASLSPAAEGPAGFFPAVRLPAVSISISPQALPIAGAAGANALMMSMSGGGGGGSGDKSSSEPNKSQSKRSDPAEPTQGAGDRPAVDPQGEPFKDPAPPKYASGHPSRPAVDHVLNRARGGHPTDPANLDVKTWEANSRKAGFEGNYTRDLQNYMRQGLSREQAEYVLQGEADFIVNDVHPRPVDPFALQSLPDQPLVCK